MESSEQVTAALADTSEEATTMTSEGTRTDGVSRLEEEASKLYNSYKTTDSKSELEKAIAIMRRVVNMLPAGRIRRAIGDFNLAAFLYDLYGLDASLETLNEAIELAEGASRVMPEKDLRKIQCLEILTFMLFGRFLHTGEIDDLEESVAIARMITDTAPANLPTRAYCFNHLGIVSHELFRHTNHEEALQEAIKALEEAVRIAMLDNHDAYQTYMDNLTAAWTSERDLKGGIEGLEKAIDDARQAVKTAVDPQSRANNLHSLGLKLLEKAEITENLANLDEAISTLRETLDIGLDKEQSQLSLLISLASALDFKHELTWEISDIEDAIDFSTKAFDMIAGDHEDAPETCTRLVERLGKHHHVTGSKADLEKAIKLGIRGLKMTPEEHLGRGRLLHNIGQRFIDLFRSSGTLDDLEQGLNYIRQAAAFIAHRAGHDWMLVARDLAMGLIEYYIMTLALGSLDEAIDILTEIARMAEGTAFDDMIFLSDLAMAYRLKYQRTNNVSYLENAVNVSTAALDQAEGDPNHAYYLELTSQILKDRYWHSRNLTDLEKSIDLGKKSIDITPEDNVQRAFRFCEVAESLRERHMATKMMEDLNEAIDFARRGLELIREDHVYRAEGLYVLATSLRLRYNITNDEGDEREMQSAFRLALDHTQSLALIRLQAGRSVVYEHVHRSQWAEAFEASKTVVDLIPSLVLRSVENADKQEVLRKAGGLASDSAALALQTGESPSTALMLLEKGRGMIATSLEDLGVDMTALEAQYPQLAERFASLRNEVRRYGDQGKDAGASWGDTRNRRRREADTELEETITEIRRHQGFEDFMLAPSESEMRQAADGGPIVIINSSTFRCDAIIVEKHQVTSLPLPRFKEEDLTRHLQGNTLDTPDALEWLWDCIAEPVLITLGLVAPPLDADWPHIWWIMPGFLGKLPIHAAGYHRDRSFKTVLDRVVSSYHNSVRSMVRRRRQPPLRDTQADQALLVAMGKTPGASDLPFASTEISIIQKPFKELSLQPTELGPSKEQILAKLPTCSIFHFAGHSFRNSKSPLDSYLALDKGPKNSITINNLLEISLYKSPPLLAYLSACGTGQMHNYQLADENIHLISGFLLAGFRHVIGTLWEVQDAVCVDMARLTYESMKERGLSDVSVAWALHNATRTLRDRWVESSEMRHSHLQKNMRLLQITGGQDDEHGERGQRSQRDVVSFEDDEQERLHWAPYVHFGS